MMKKELLFTLGRPLSPFYGLLMRLRERLYQSGVWKTYHFEVPVFSVGNLNLGGTGKTPLVQYIARRLQEQQKKVAIVSRGYGGSSREAVNVVSDGKTVYLSAEIAGDEPRLLAETLPGVQVVTGKSRRFPAEKAVDSGCEVIILDDGFQHMSVARNLDLVLFSAGAETGEGLLHDKGRHPAPRSH